MKKYGDTIGEGKAWPVPTEGFISTFFADHAISRIMEALETGEVLKDGMSTWY